MSILSFATAAVLLQIGGYLAYIIQVLRKEVRPNSATWFMFAYGVTLLTILERERGASMSLLLLPIACAALSVVVAFICWKRGTLKWPEEIEDRVAFIADLALTAGYIAAWLLAFHGTLSEEGRGVADLVFLFGSNATTVTAFIPILRNTAKHPGHERSIPWVIWALAYSSLAIATYQQGGFYTELMIYPVMNACLHAYVAVLARPKRRRLATS